MHIMVLVERRKAKRFPLRLPMRLCWSDGKAPREVHTKTNDLSSEAVCFSLSHKIEIGCSVELTLAFNPGDLRVSGTGQVVRCSNKRGAVAHIVVVMECLRFIHEQSAADEFEIHRKIFFGL